jgi:glycosyltransferase involved in cell wall biosynthesis
MFGPIQGDIDHLGLGLPNIVIHETLVDIHNADFSKSYGFIFTSLFEGMPNVVLEMSQHAIPMILADVGGLRDTFEDDTIMFITHEPNPNETALKFSNALDMLVSKSSTEVVAMVSSSRQQVLRRHSPMAYSANVKSLFDI